MKSLMIFTFPLLILLGNPVNAAKLAEPVVQVSARDLYQGGFPLALAASETAGCPAAAPVLCQNAYTPLGCCPAGQSCHITANEQYCCPTSSDCHDAVVNFLVCANSSWILYQGVPNYFCCEPGYIASERIESGPGYCEPADVNVPSDRLAPTISQDTAAASIPASTTAAAATSASETTETQTAVTGTITTTADAVSTDTTTPTDSITATANGISTISFATATAKTTASSTGSKVTIIAPSVQTSGTVTTLLTAGTTNSGSVSTSASASVKPATSIGASNNAAVMGIVVLLCFGVGFLELIG